MATGRQGRRLVAAGACAALLAACSGGGEAVVAATPTPTPTAAPSPTAPAPVAMSQRVEAVQVNADDILSKHGGITPSRRAMDERALAGVAESLVALLTSHLDDLNLGGRGMLDEVGAQVFAVDPALTALATTALASPANTATAADLVLRVGVDGIPRWAEAQMAVTRQDGSVVDLDLVFATDGDLTLVLLGGQEVT